MFEFDEVLIFSGAVTGKSATTLQVTLQVGNQFVSLHAQCFRSSENLCKLPPKKFQELFINSVKIVLQILRSLNIDVIYKQPRIEI